MRRNIILIASLISLSLITASILYIQSNYFNKTIESQIIPLVEDAIGRKIEFSESHFNILPFYWQLYNVTLRDVKTGEALIKSKDVIIYIRPRRIFKKQVAIRNIRFMDPDLSLIRYPDGKTNLEGLFPQKKTTAWHITLENIDITNGNIFINDQPGLRTIKFWNTDAKIKPSLGKKEVMGNFNLKGSYKDKNISQEDLTIKGEVSIDFKERAIRTVKVNSLSIISADKSKIWIDGELNNKGPLNIKGNGIIPLNEITKYVKHKKDLQGRMKFAVGIKGTFIHPLVEGNFTVEDLAYDHIKYGKLNSDISYKDKLISLSNLKGKVFNGDINGDINLEFDKKINSFNSFLKVVNLQPYKFITNYSPRLGGSLQKNGIVSGEIRINGKGLDKSMFEGNGWLTYKDNNQSFSLSGEIREDLNLSIGVSGELTDIASYLHIPYFPLHGHASLTGEISGTVEKPVVSGVVMMPKGVVKDVLFDSITADLSFTEGMLQLQPVTLRRDDAIYKMNGNIHFRSPGFKDPYFELTGEITQASPKDIVSIFYNILPLDMKTDGHIKFSGDSKNLLFIADLRASPGSMYGQSFDDGRINLSINKERVIFDKVILKKGEDILSGNGWIGFRGESRGEFMADISSEQFRLEDIDIIKKRTMLLRGTSTFKITGSGKMTDPLIKGTISISNLFIKDVDTGPAYLSLSKEDNELKINGNSLDMNFNGAIAWNRDAPFKLVSHLDDTVLHPFFSILKPAITMKVSIKASGDAVIEGRLSDPDTIQADIRLSRVNGSYSDYLIENDGEIILSYSENKLTFDSVRFKGEGTSLSIIGALVNHRDINMFINGEADLRLLTLLTPEIKYSKGKAFIAFLISGEAGHPSLQGGLAIKDGSVRSATFKQSFEDVNISVFFNGREIILESIQASVGGGKLSGSGKVGVEEFNIKEFGFILEIAGAVFRYPEGLQSRIDGTFVLQGTPESKSLKGEVIIKKAAFEKNLNIRTMILELQREKVKVDQPIPFWGDTELNIHFGGKRDIWINNNLAKLPVEVDLLLKGTIDHPLLFGRIAAQDGTFIFSRNAFKVISATADFISPDTIRPVIDIHASTEVRGYIIDLSLSGTVDKFNLSLNSDPPLSETDILALLTVGQTAAEVSETMSEVGAVEATAFLAAPIQEKIENTLQDIIKIDRFQVDPYYSSSTASEGARLTVGKRLMDDKLYVTYTTGITTVEELIKLEYFLGRNVYIVGERDEQGRMNGDIKFRFEFR